MTEPNKKPVRYMDFVGGRRSSSTDPFISRPQAKKVVSATSHKPSSPVQKKPLSSSLPSSSVQRSRSVSSSKNAVSVPASASYRQPSKIKSAERRILYSKKPVLEEKKTKATLERSARPKAPGKTISISDRIEKQPSQSSGTLAQKASATLAASKNSLEFPDNNAYSLGGKSPFLENYSIDKRPLSDSVPSKKKTEDYEKLSFLGVSDSQPETKKRKNQYEKKPKKTEQKKKKDSHAPVTIIDNSAKKSSLPIAIVIIITILLGAAVGAGIYFLLPK